MFTNKNEKYIVKKFKVRFTKQQKEQFESMLKDSIYYFNMYLKEDLDEYSRYLDFIDKYGFKAEDYNYTEYLKYLLKESYPNSNEKDILKMRAEARIRIEDPSFFTKEASLSSDARASIIDWIIKGFKFIKVDFKKKRIKNIPQFKRWPDKQILSIRIKNGHHKIWFKNNDRTTHRLVGITKFKDLYIYNSDYLLDEDKERIKGCMLVKGLDGNYYIHINISYDKDEMRFTDLDGTIGIDVGIKNYAVVAGIGKPILTFGNPFKIYPELNKYDKKIDSLTSIYKRKIRYHKDKYKDYDVDWIYDNIIHKSNTIQNAIQLKNKHYKRKLNILYDFIYKITKKIIELHPKKIIIEDLHIDDIKEKHIRVAMKRRNFSRFFNHLAKKCKFYGIELRYVDNSIYPSSNTCYRCGYIHDIKDSRIFRCPNCGLELDRDINAAYTLSKVPNSISKKYKV